MHAASSPPAALAMEAAPGLGPMVSRCRPARLACPGLLVSGTGGGPG